jgi:hyperosmotically inducible protein
MLIQSHVNVSAETPPETTPEALPPKPKEPEVKPKEPEVKPPDAKPKEGEQKLKDGEQKAKEPELKPKEAEPKAKEPDTKQREPEAKPKEGTKPKDGETKPNHQEQKSKEPDKPKDTELSEKPCPQIHQPSEGKTAQDGAPPPDPAAGDKPKNAESEAKKPIRSPMVTAKLALMADPRLFPYDIEVDSKDKDLVLLGKVVSESDKRAATEIVRCLEGVHAVENRMKIEADASYGLGAERDKVIVQLVKERFEKSKTLQSIKFEIKAEHGVLYLAGSTRFQVIILEAAQAARQVPGVKAVNTEAVRLVSGE